MPGAGLHEDGIGKRPGIRPWNPVLLAVFGGLFLGVATAVHGQQGIWTTSGEVSAIPMKGAAWDQLLADAQLPITAPSLSNQNSPMNVRALAKALVYARTNDPNYRQEVIALFSNYWNGGIFETENASQDSLPISRELASYVLAADLVVLDATTDNAFRTWLSAVRNEVFADGRTLISTHEDRANNWGTNAGASRIAAAIYLQDLAELESAADVFKGWLGDRSAYTGFTFGGHNGDLSWQADSLAPVGINPLGSTKFGANTDGVLPEEMRRHFQSPWEDADDYPPFPQVNYAYEGLQGALVQGVLLHRQGYDVWNWEDQALLRAFQWIHAPDPDGPGFPPDPAGDDGWMSYLVNHYYGASFPENVQPMAGKNLGWTDWSHGCEDLVTDADSDLIPDSCDNCVGLSNPEQLDQDLDGVGDACDNCVKLANPPIPSLAFQTTTGGQLDDDADGFGNACDADLNGVDMLVNPADLTQLVVSYGKKRAKTNCGLTKAEPCDMYDLNGDGFLIGPSDLARFIHLYGAKRGKGLWVRCPTCPLPCAGDNCTP